MNIYNYSEIIQKAYFREFESQFSRTKNLQRSKVVADRFLSQMVQPEESEKQIYIEATVCEMSASDVLPKELVDKIKLTDPNPCFVVYDIGGVGASNGSLNGKGTKKIWGFGAIKELVEKIKEGAKVVLGHGEGFRKELGTVVYSYAKKIKDSLRAVAVAYITDENTKEKIKQGLLDLCSIEGIVNFRKENENYYINSVKSVDYLTIASSASDTAGFAGAGVIGVIQELEKGDNMEKKSIDLKDVKLFLAENNINPFDLGYTVKDIVSQPEVIGYIEEEKTNSVKEMKLLNVNLEKKVKDLSSFKNKITVSDFVKNSKELANKDNRTIEFIKEQLNLNLSDELTDRQKQDIVNEAVAEKIKVMEKFGVTFADKGEDKPGVTQVGSNGKASGSPDDYSNPDINPLLKTE